MRISDWSSDVCSSDLMMSWTLHWRIARLHRVTRAIRQLVGRLAEWPESFPGSDCTFALLFAALGAPAQGRRHLRRLMDAGLRSEERCVGHRWILAERCRLTVCT